MPVQVRWFTPYSEKWSSGLWHSFAKRAGRKSCPGSNPGFSATHLPVAQLEQSGWLRTSRSGVRVFPGRPHTPSLAYRLCTGLLTRRGRFDSGPLDHCPVAQQAERRSYKADVGGSKPSRATNITAVAQRNRARPCDGRGRAFKSSPACQHTRRVRNGQVRGCNPRYAGSSPAGVSTCPSSLAVERRVYTPLAPDKRQVARSNRAGAPRLRSSIGTRAPGF